MVHMEISSSLLACNLASMLPAMAKDLQEGRSRCEDSLVLFPIVKLFWGAPSSFGEKGQEKRG